MQKEGKEKRDQIGAKILSPSMMSCSFQYTESVLEIIEGIRTLAAKVHDSFNETLRNSPNEAVMNARGYNNAVSILGSRGSGKTSIIMTLQHILKVGKEAWIENEAPSRYQMENIIMPILVPQDFTAEQSLLSWVIIQLLQKAEEVEKELARENNYLFWSGEPLSNWATHNRLSLTEDPLRACMDKLIASFELRYRCEYKQVSEGEQIYHYMDTVERDSELMMDMLKLISIMADYYRQKIYKYEYSGEIRNKEPLFIFVIDDMDLAPERSHEVINLVLRYLQHPNIVVLCGWNQELFQNHLSIEVLKSQGALNSSLIDTNFGFDDVFMSRQRKRLAALDSARRLAMDNLKKAFPPAQRFEIRGLSTMQRACFPHLPSKGKIVSDPDSFFMLIEDCLYQCIATPKESIDDLKAKRKGVFRFLYDDLGEQLLVYMRIFDNKARGMINVYRAFEAFRERIIAWDHVGELDVTGYIKSILDTILFSNTRFAPYRRGIRDLVRIDEIVISPQNPSKRVCKYYCNYERVRFVLSDYKSRTDYETHRDLANAKYRLEREYNYFPSIIIDVFLLLNFMENMVRYITDFEESEHGGLAFSQILNQINPPIEIGSATEDLLTQAVAATGIRAITFFPITESIRTNIKLLDTYEKNGFMDQQYHIEGGYNYCRLFDVFFEMVSKDEQINIKELRRLYKRDPQWVMKMLQLFIGLRYDDGNVIRLVFFKSLLLQKIYGENESVAMETSAFDFSAATNFLTMGGNKRRSVTDADMNYIVECLRVTDRFRRESSRYSSHSSLEIRKTYTQRAAAWLKIFAQYIGDGENKSYAWLDIEAFRRSMNLYKAYRVSEEEWNNSDEDDQSNKDMVNSALALADEV